MGQEQSCRDETLRACRPLPGLLHHSYCGSPYASDAAAFVLDYLSPIEFELRSQINGAWQSQAVLWVGGIFRRNPRAGVDRWSVSTCGDLGFRWQAHQQGTAQRELRAGHSRRNPNSRNSLAHERRPTQKGDTMTTMTSVRLLTLSACALLAACSGSTKAGDGTGGGAGSSGSAGTSSGGAGAGMGGSAGSAGSSGGAAGACGSAPPKNGSPCERSSSGTGFTTAECSWGEDPRPACRTHGTCNSGAWSITPPNDGCAVDPQPAACPTAPATEGASCSDATLQCWYDDGAVCSCSACEGGSEYPLCRTIDPPQWACVKPQAGCPNPAPQAGSACDDPQLQCGTSCELPIRCEGGIWQYGQEMCPICASPLTPIATPSGDRPIAELRVGDLVYSVEGAAIVAVPIARIASTRVFHHEVLKIALDDGATLEISAGHPLASGKPLSSLAEGSHIDEQHRVISIEQIPYTYDRTYDILPRSSSGTYFAAGALLGSTLFTPERAFDLAGR